MKKIVKVTFEEGNMIVTGFNGSIEEIIGYYPIGVQLNLGCGDEDNMQTITKVEIDVQDGSGFNTY